MIQNQGTATLTVFVFEAVGYVAVPGLAFRIGRTAGDAASSASATNIKAFSMSGHYLVGPLPEAISI